MKRTLESHALMACVQIGKMLTSTIDSGEILKLIMSKVSELIRADNWSLLLLDEETGALSFKVVVGLDPAGVKDVRIPLGSGIAGTCAQTGQPLFITDAQNDSRFNRDVDKKTGFVTRSLICLPLRVREQILGVIEVVNIDDIEHFKSKYLPILEILSDYAAIALENSRCFSRIERLTIVDEYTGLYNARYLQQNLSDILSRADRTGSPVAVAFVDIDNFKQVVDTYGHLAGSGVLREIGHTMLKILGADNLLIKYGGDEYIIILPGRGKEEAAAIIRRILDSVRRATYLVDETEEVRVTASFGLAIYPDDADTKKDLLLTADHLMYRIKKGRKNGIAVRE